MHAHGPRQLSSQVIQTLGRTEHNMTPVQWRILRWVLGSVAVVNGCILLLTYAYLALFVLAGWSALSDVAFIVVSATGAALVIYGGWGFLERRTDLRGPLLALGWGSVIGVTALLSSTVLALATASGPKSLLWGDVWVTLLIIGPPVCAIPGCAFLVGRFFADRLAEAWPKMHLPWQPHESCNGSGRPN